jgi:hypothetical protein
MDCYRQPIGFPDRDSAGVHQPAREKWYGVINTCDLIFLSFRSLEIDQKSSRSRCSSPGIFRILMLSFDISVATPPSGVFHLMLGVFAVGWLVGCSLYLTLRI